MDWFSRHVIAGQISNTLEVGFRLKAMDQSLTQGRPAIFNTDQRTQFTSLEFTGSVLDAEIQISMDGSGRHMDNIFIERLWRTVKYKNIYLSDYESEFALAASLNHTTTTPSAEGSEPS